MKRSFFEAYETSEGMMMIITILSFVIIIIIIIIIVIVMINKTKAITVHSASVFASPLAPSPCSPNSPPRK